MHPMIKGGQYTGVMEIIGIDERPDLRKPMNLLIDFVHGPGKETARDENESLGEIARTINLHMAAGYKPENLQ